GQFAGCHAEGVPGENFAFGFRKYGRAGIINASHPPILQPLVTHVDMRGFHPFGFWEVSTRLIARLICDEVSNWQLGSLRGSVRSVTRISDISVHLRFRTVGRADTVARAPGRG